VTVSGWANGRRWILTVLLAAGAFLGGARWEKARASRMRGRAPAGPTRAAASSRPAAPTGDSRGPRAALLAGEFEPQAAVLLSCHELAGTFPQVFKDVVSALHPAVPVVCLVSNPAQRGLLRGLLTEARVPLDAVRLLDLPLDTMWVRDYGPVFLRGPGPGAFVADMDYTPAEENQECRLRDDMAPRLIGEALGLPVIAVPLRLGGGNLLSNGQGLCVTTTSLLEDNLDRGYDARKIRALLGRHFGFRQWVCLQRLAGEPTGHVDMFVALLAPDLAVVGQCDVAEDPTNAAILDAAAAELARQHTPRGPLRVVRVPMPEKVDGLWRSYTNILLANGVALVPTFSDVDAAIQDRVLDLYRRLLPGWKVVGIGADSLLNCQGLLHCISVNVPDFIAVPRHLSDGPTLQALGLPALARPIARPSGATRRPTARGE